MTTANKWLAEKPIFSAQFLTDGYNITLTKDSGPITVYIPGYIAKDP